MRYLVLLILLWASNVCLAQTGEDTIMNRIVLIGDAGALVDGKAPVMQAVKQFVPMDKKTTVVYLGDNLYRVGLPDEQNAIYTKLRSVLDSQVALVLGTKAMGYMIPGNHDWENGGQGGYEAVVREQRYVDGLSDNLVYYPKDGCPGPIDVKVGKDVVIIMMDSQWWLHTGPKPGIDSDCPNKTKSEVLSEIEDILMNNPEKLVLFACHHPFISNGYHGGYFGWRQHIFPFLDLNKKLYIPLPILGSIYPLSRSVFGSPQDVKHPTYANMIDTIKAVTSNHPNLIFVAGHEHTLQYFADSTHHYVVSGSGCKSGSVAQSKRAEFVSRLRGFAVLEVSTNKNVRLSFYTVEPTKSEVAYTKNILNFSTPTTVKDTIPQAEPAYIYKDSALVAASTQYRDVSKLKRRMMGSNYREEWATQVKMKVFNINKEKGGLKITEFGGGRQTRTLTLEDKQGVEYKLRTIDKEPEHLIPLDMRGNLASPVVQDLVSASHPYSSLVVPGLSDAVNVPHTFPQYFFVPDDPSLGFYQSLFANKVCMLERKSPLSPKINTRSTAKLLNKMIEDNDHVVDQTSVLRARLLDIVIGDWDRHMDQWRWEVGDTGKGKIYYPIPRDRDEAFFYSDGLLLQYLSRNKLPFLKGFRKSIPRINWFGYMSRDFDRLFLNGLDQKQWEKTIDEFQANLTDSVIEQSVRKLPQDIYAISGQKITDKLKSRRELLKKEGIEYFDFISTYVNVLGSHKKEYFKVSESGNGIKVQVYARNEESDTSFLNYSRDFDPDHTKEVRLFGFNGDDIFHVDENVKSKIKLRVIGGRGVDTFDMKGNVKNVIYDFTPENNIVVADNKSNDEQSATPDVNYFDYHDFKYQQKRSFPRPNVGFNTEDGPMLGIGFWFRTYGFRKEPFATENKLTTLYSTIGKAYRIRYNGVFIEAINKTDIVINSQFVNPTLNNFFGLGNETKNLPEYSRTFYRVRYKLLEGDLLFRRRFYGKVRVALGPSFSYYWIRRGDNQGRILEQPELVGLTTKDVYDRKTYAGGKFVVNVNNLNNEIFPTRGVDWNTEFQHLTGLNKNATPLTKFHSEMSVHASFTDPARLVAVLRLGGGHIFSKDYEYFQALNLGTNNYLRGFRKNRFAGSSMYYTSLELWYKIKDLNSAVIPGSFGVVGFNDVGRVWIRTEDSKKWHHGYGGGLYYMPFNLIILSGTVALSEEETLFNFSIGTKINITY